MRNLNMKTKYHLESSIKRVAWGTLCFLPCDCVKHFQKIIKTKISPNLLKIGPGLLHEVLSRYVMLWGKHQQENPTLPYLLAWLGFLWVFPSTTWSCLWRPNSLCSNEKLCPFTTCYLYWPSQESSTSENPPYQAKTPYSHWFMLQLGQVR